MEGYRILIVEDHVQSRTEMAEYLRKQEGVALVREAGNGAEALKLLKEEPFEIMITDIIMPQMDGYALLEEMRRRNLPNRPQTIVVSALGRDDFVTRAIELGATFYMVKPFDMRHLMSHIRDLSGGKIKPAEAAAPAARETQNRRVQTLDERLGSLFLTIGIPAHIKGYQFLRQAVKMVVEDPDRINRITKELYPGIARYFGTSASKVERAIRHAIEVAWNRGRVETLNTAFGCRVCTPEDKPTNGEFIAMIADKLSMERSA
mgnify:FL=1